MDKKIRVGVLFGGQSAEHEISLLSARSVVAAMDRNRYEIVLIGIEKNGEWYTYPSLETHLINPTDPKKIRLKAVDTPVALVAKLGLVGLGSHDFEQAIDLLFPVLHGTYGEDGTIQGLCKLVGIPFVGAGILSSAVNMDKDVMKRLLREEGIPIAKSLSFTKTQFTAELFTFIQETLGLPFFVKPANTGSSVGISKIKHASEFLDKCHQAFQFDNKIIFEENIVGREIECSVLGNEDPIASLPGEVVPQHGHEFYSYEAKYLDDDGARLDIPAQVTEAESTEIRRVAIAAYTSLYCEGMARVDMFLQADGQVLLNEVNTIPGFTKISMYPKLWEISGITYSQLINRLIELAFERFNREADLQKNVDDLYQNLVSDQRGVLS